MKTLKKLKLIQLSKNELENREMGMTRGGNGSCCICGCRYWDDGGSSTVDNGNANNAGGLESPGGGWGNGDFWE